MRGTCLPADRPCAAAWYSAVYCARRAKRSRIWPPRSSARRSAQRCWLALCLRLNLGVHGAGIAMLARETAVFVVLLGYALRHGELIRPSLRRARFTLPVFAEIMRYGLPTLLRQGATSLSAAMLSRVSAEFGAPVLAGMGLCARAVMPFTSAVIGFGQGFQPSAARPSAQSKRRAAKPRIASVSASCSSFRWPSARLSLPLPRR